MCSLAIGLYFIFFGLVMFAVHCCGDLICLLSVVTDSLKFTSALSVALAVVFLVITVGIAIIKLISGGVQMPRLIPDVTDLTSLLNLFTVVPVLVTAYICHYNGMEAVYSFMGIFFFFFLHPGVSVGIV